MLFLSFLTPIVGGQKRHAESLELTRRNPDGWFSLLVPTNMGPIGRHADVDGGFYSTPRLEIDFDYWPYDGTPNFLRGPGGLYSKAPILACSKSSKHGYTKRLSVAGERAIIQKCLQRSKAGHQKYSYLYYITFPKIKVRDYGYGMFSLTVSYKTSSYETLASRIVRSIRFRRSI